MAIITFLIIPVILANIRYSPEEKSCNSLFDPVIPKDSSVYYENTAGSASKIYVSGDYAYVADGPNGLAVINISTPTNPGAPVYESTTGSAEDIYVSGDYVYLADGVSGLAVIDISDPTNPGSLYYEDNTEYAYGVFVSGDYAYVADWDHGLAVFDISDPTNPGTPVHEDTNGQAWGVFISGDYAYVADGDAGLAIIDISDPTNPGTPVYENTNGFAYDIYVEGDHAFLADGDSGLVIIDISDPINPGIPIYEDTTGSSHAIHICGDWAYLADGASGMVSIDISDLTDPNIPAYEDTSGFARGIDICGNYAYVGTGSSGLAIIDIAQLIDPTIPVYESTNNYSASVYISGNYAYVANWEEGLAIFDISDPTNPGIPIYQDTNGQAFDVEVSGDYAYIADSYQGLAVIDVSDPLNPTTPIYEDTTSLANDIHISGDYVYIACGNSGLAVINISDPTNPGTPIYQDTSGGALDVCVNGDYAYIADESSGLAIINISDPLNPGTPIYEDTTFYACGVYVSGDYAYVADGLDGLAIIDITDPTNPSTPIYEDTSSWAYSVHVDGDYAFVATNDMGLVVMNVSDPTNPSTLFYEVTTDAGDVFISGDYAFIADGYSGLAVIQVRERYDFIDPIITAAPSDFTLESIYQGITISWTAMDSNPDTYMIQLQGSGIVEGPTAWSSGSAINYSVPNGLPLGEYFYAIAFIDDNSNYAADTVKMTIQDTYGPQITDYPIDFILELGYTGESLSWTATDPYPNMYTIELQGTGIVEGPTAWSNDVPIIYNIPDGFAVGDYFYVMNMTDDYGNFFARSVKMTIEDTTSPSITSIPIDFNLDHGYTGESISWTATDGNPNTYSIELQGTGIVEGPTAWSSSVAIIYNIPDGLAIGEYFYAINFTDDYDNFATDIVKLTVNEIDVPIITNTPIDFIIESGYTGETISWIATDANPNTYSIELQGTGIVEGLTTWSSGVVIVYNIPDGLAVGEYFYTVNFTDAYGRYATDTVKLTIQDTTNPLITSFPSDITIESGYTGETISWTATDANPYTYTIDLQGSGIVGGPNIWLSGILIIYNIPDGLAVGEYSYTVNFSDDNGNYVTDTVIVTVREPSTAPSVPFGNFYLIFLAIGIIAAVIIQKRKNS